MKCLAKRVVQFSEDVKITQGCHRRDAHIVHREDISGTIWVSDPIPMTDLFPFFG